jgi:hypothetical protein
LFGDAKIRGRVRRARFRQFSNRKDNPVRFGKRIHGRYQDLSQFLLDGLLLWAASNGRELFLPPYPSLR